jgi:hypothetical protein
MRRSVAVAAAVLSLTACGSPSSGATHVVGQVALTVSGGFTGWNRTLAVDPDGTARLTVSRGPAPARGPHAVPAAILKRLRSEVSDPAFAQLLPDYPAPAGSADVQTYAISAEVDGRKLATTTHDGASPPHILQEVLATLVEILDSFNAAAEASCSAGYSPGSPSHQLANQDSGRTLTVHVCDSIWILLTGATAVPWQSPHSSDASVLTMVPLPLPAPPPGGARAVYLANATGTAMLSASRTLSCPPDAMCEAPAPWTVTVTVVK